MILVVILSAALRGCQSELLLDDNYIRDEPGELNDSKIRSDLLVIKKSFSIARDDEIFVMIISFTTDLTYKLVDYCISNWMSCSMFQQYYICSTILVSFFSILRLKSQATEHTKRRKRVEQVGFEQFSFIL